MNIDGAKMLWDWEDDRFAFQEWTDEWKIETQYEDRAQWVQDFLNCATFEEAVLVFLRQNPSVSDVRAIRLGHEDGGFSSNIPVKFVRVVYRNKGQE